MSQTRLTGDRGRCPGHGTYQGLDLELPDPADEDELTFLIEARHTNSADRPRR
jgi:hypothetical protein